MPNIQIDIVSDIACPWCAIGYARLEKAMEQLGDDFNFDIQWHAFELDPNHDGIGEPILPALAKKYGSTEQEIWLNQTQMMSIAQDLGLNFDKLQERFTANTFDAHRLVKWAANFDQQTAMKKALFDAYFGQGVNVAEQAVLLNCVKTLGLDTEEAKRVLESDEYAEAVREEEAISRQTGINSVPAFIINNKYLISGAQEPASLVQALREISTESV